MFDGDRSALQGAVPFLVFLGCGIAGVGVDVFDGVALLVDGFGWLHELDVLAAVCYTVAIGGLGACIALRRG